MTWHMMLSMLRRHSLLPLLVLLQVTVACAILCNVLFLTWQQVQPMLAPTGIDTRDLVLIDRISAAHGMWTAPQIRAGTEALREVPGVEAVSPAMGLPMVTTVLSVDALEGPTHVKVGTDNYGGKGLLHILGAKLVAGRDFLPSEYRPMSFGKSNPTDTLQPIIITAALAHKLFGHRPAVGGILHEVGDKTGGGYQVVGVVAHLMGTQVDRASKGESDDTVLIPEEIIQTPWLTYAIRVKPGTLAFALPALRRAVTREFGPLMQVGSKANVESYAARRSKIFAHQRAAVGLLAGIVIVVLIVAVAGIMGLTGFWVQRRTKQIGIRRALGARRRDILTWILSENVLITSVGIVLGMALAYGGNLWLMQHYELDRLPWQYLPIGAVCMLALGQLAVLGPALHAARVPPVVATRTI